MSHLRRLSSDKLLVALLRLVGSDRRLEAELLEHLGEVDCRRLYLREGCSSMFGYCVEVLHFSEAAAFKRIGAARAARRFPALLAALRAGALHVTAMRLLAPRLTAGNFDELVALGTHRTGKEIQALLADREPKPDVVVFVRRKANPGTDVSAPANAPATTLPYDSIQAPAQPGPVAASDLPAHAAEVDAAINQGVQVPASRLQPPPVTHGSYRSKHETPEPLGHNRYSVRFTATSEMYDQLQELQDLMRHQIPDGDLTQILARAVAVLLAQVRKQKFGEIQRAQRELSAREELAPGKKPVNSRGIPAAIRRAVSQRDEGRCTYVSASGRRCGSRSFIEFHHVVPWAKSPRHHVDGITLRCRAHNQLEAERDFGQQHMARFKKPSAQISAGDIGDGVESGAESSAETRAPPE